MKADTIGTVVAELKKLLPGKPAYVLETGYPVQYSNPSQSGAYYTEALQAEFIEKAFDAAQKAGASGFFYAGVWSDTSLHHHIVGTAWGRWSGGRNTPFAFRVLGPSIERDDVHILKQWVDKEGVHAKLSFALLEGFEHFGNHYAPNGTAWGLVDPVKKVQRQGFAALVKSFAKVKGLEVDLASISNEITKRHGTGLLK